MSSAVRTSPSAPAARATEPVAMLAGAEELADGIVETLRVAGLKPVALDPVTLLDALTAATVAAVAIADRDLARLSHDALAAALAAQPVWSDPTFLVIAGDDPAGAAACARLAAVANVSRIAHPASHEEVKGAVLSAVRTRARQHAVRASLLDLAVRAEAVDPAAPDGFLTVRDGEQERLAQLRGLHRSQLSAMGTMASTLAHELNQPLAAVVNNVRGSRRLIEASGTSPPKVCAALDAAFGSAMRAGEIVRHLRELIGDRVVARRPEPLARLIRDVEALSAGDGDTPGIRCEIALDPAAGRVMIDRIQIQHVLVMLIAHVARAAGGGRPVVRIATRQMDDDRVEIAITRVDPGTRGDALFARFVDLASDGADFAPGLGLLIGRTIVEAHEGTITTERAGDDSAIVRFTLPAAPAAISVAAPT